MKRLYLFTIAILSVLTFLSCTNVNTIEAEKEIDTDERLSAKVVTDMQ